MLEELEVHAALPYEDRPYEWVEATARFAVDPGDPANAAITDLDRVPGGTPVRFDADVRLLRPTGAANGKLLVVVPNRGLLGGVPFSLDAPSAWSVEGPPAAGDGFLLEHGWTIAWCGWQWDVIGGLGLRAPLADVEPGRVRIEFRPDADQARHALSDSSALFTFAPVPAADDDGELTVRTTPMGPRANVPREHWRFVGDEVELDGGFRAFHWYELVYRSALAPVVGTGLLAFRDLVAHLRPGFRHTYAYGISQSGRFLRELLHLGFDTGDGVFVHVASARRGEFNQRYGQPALTHPLTPGYGPPHDTASLLARHPDPPKLLQTNTAWEYWRGDGALVHQEARTGADLPEPAGTRVHLLAGADHFGTFPLKAALPTANPVHLLDVGPVLRALFVQLDEWVSLGIEPTPSTVPRRGDGSLVERTDVLGRFGVDGLALPWTPAIDPTSTTWPLPLGDPLVALVSDVDEGGNEVAGIRLPEVAAGAAAFTGWNPRRAVAGLPDVLYEFAGSRLPLRRERLGREAFEAAARAAAADLVAARFLLVRDVERAVQAALDAYDAA